MLRTPRSASGRAEDGRGGRGQTTGFPAFAKLLGVPHLYCSPVPAAPLSGPAAQTPGPCPVPAQPGHAPFLHWPRPVPVLAPPRRAVLRRRPRRGVGGRTAPPPPPQRPPAQRLPRAPRFPAAARTMAAPAPRVHYLAGFSCPVGGLAAGPRVLPLGAEVLLAAGRELVYVYDREARQLTVSAGSGRGARPGGGPGARVSGGGVASEERVRTGASAAPPRPPGGVQVSRAGVAPGGPGPPPGAAGPVRPQGHLLPVFGPGPQVRRVAGQVAMETAGASRQ